MRANKTSVIAGGLSAVSVLALTAGWLWGSLPMIAAGATGVGYVAWRWAPRPGRRRKRAPAVPASGAVEAEVRPRAAPVDPTDSEALVEQMLAQGRYGLLLRPQIARNLNDAQLARARAALEEAMALVPEGEVVLGKIDEMLDGEDLDEEEAAAYQGRAVRVGCYFLDRYPVTNEQYYEFVAAGGYEQLSLWDESIWTAVLEFVDRTGEPGPRYWKNGRYESRWRGHPVVGVSWYEAAAYARWVGKRLPSDAEWVKAGSWPVTLSSTSRVQRKYPWGDTMDRSRANLWGSGPGTTVSVDRFAEGVSVGGVHQLIGNVWEWTRGDLRASDLRHPNLTLSAPMKSIRGGAFDTYFDGQATCQFQSGETPMGRKHNIGFRCAVGICDLMLSKPPADAAVPDGLENAPAEEVPV
jgi:iron(II)-dependent oxidoreductase